MNAQEFKAHMQLISVQAREDIETAHKRLMIFFFIKLT